MTFFLGVASVIVGPLIMSWVSPQMKKGLATIVIDVLSTALISMGLYLLAKVNLIALIISIPIGIGSFVIGQHYQARPKTKAREIFKIYKQVKADHPEASEQEVYRKTAKQYYKSATDWVKVRVDMTAGTVAGFGDSPMEEPENPKELAENIIMFEESSFRSGNFTPPRKAEKRKKAVESAYKSMIEQEEKTK